MDIHVKLRDALRKYEKYESDFPLVKPKAHSKTKAVFCLQSFGMRSGHVFIFIG